MMKVVGVWVLICEQAGPVGQLDECNHPDFPGGQLRVFYTCAPEP